MGLTERLNRDGGEPFAIPPSYINPARIMYKKIPVKKLTGQEQFKNIGQKKFSVLDFWQYGYSSLNDNVLRGALAEFIVENALKDKEDIKVRSAWGDYDVDFKGKKVEVKCCSYIQDWDQKDYSVISWSGLKARELYYSDAVKKQSELNSEKDYKADVYVLSLFKHKDHATLDILDMDQWDFYVLSRDELKEISNNGSSMSLVKLKKSDIEPISFNELADVIK